MFSRNKNTNSDEFIALPRPKFIVISEDDEQSDIGDRRSYAKKSRASEFDTNLTLQRNNAFVYMILPPDGGYGLVIELLSFLNQLIVDGIVLGTANLFSYISFDLREPLYLTGLIMGIQVGFYFLCGVIASAFVNKYGFRPVGVMGVTAAIITLGIASFISNLTLLIIFYSILGGFSLSLVWISSQLIVGYYFEKYRPIAVGIASSGAGLGIAIINLLNSTLLPIINWRNMIRVYMLLLTIVFMLLVGYIDIRPTHIGKIMRDDQPLWSETESSDSEQNADIKTYSIASVQKDNGSVIEITSDITHAIGTHKGSTFPHETTLVGRCCPWMYNSYCCKRFFKQSDDTERIVVIKPDILDRHDAFHVGSLISNNELSTSKRSTSSRPTLKVALDTSEEKIRTITTRMQYVHKKEEAGETGRTRKLIRALILLFDWHLMTIKEFRILWFSALFFPMGLNVPLTYAAAQADIAKLGLFVTPCIGLSNFVVRIASGFVAFRYRQHTTIFCGGGLMFGGLFVFLNGLCGSGIVWFQFIFCICWGVAPAVFATLRSLVYARFLGLDKLTNAIGLTALAMGSGMFIGVTINCLMFKYTHALHCSYMFAGICVMLSGALKLSLLFFKSK